MTSIILASASSARASMLRQAGVVIDVSPALVDEAALKTALLSQGVKPRDIADALAEAKAVKVSARHPGLVIGADSTLELDGRLYDKPSDPFEARDHLRQFRNKTHKLHSAAVAAEGGVPIWRQVTTASMTMRDFSDAFLDAYMAAEGDALLTTVGCYRLEGLGAQLFNAIDGDYFAILGLPLSPLLDFLRERGVIPS